MSNTNGQPDSDKPSENTGKNSYNDRIMQKLEEIQQYIGTSSFDRKADETSGTESDLSTLSAITTMMPAITSMDKYLVSAHTFGQEMSNLTQMQQKNNLLALSATSGCIRQMLNLNPQGVVESSDGNTSNE